MLTCKRMRSIVIVSAILLILGVLVEFIVQIAPFGAPSVTPALLSALAASSVLSALTLLTVAFLVSLLPGTARRLSECQH